MKRKIFGFCACVVALACFLPAARPMTAAAAEEKKEWKIPEDAKGFVGILEGEIISKNVEGLAYVLKVNRVLKTLEGNKAKKPDKLKNEKAVILIQNSFAGGKITPDEKQAAFLKEVKVGAKVEVSVKSDLSAKLRMSEVPKMVKETEKGEKAK